MHLRSGQVQSWLSADEVKAFLRRSGVSDSDTIDQVLDGFDFDHRPLYFRTFEPGEVLFQYLRGDSYKRDGPRTGNWFCLLGATRDSLAIFGGATGRRRYKFEVVHPFTTIEGVARPQSRNWDWAGGGKGGGTQVYVPPNLLGHIASHGPDE